MRQCRASSGGDDCWEGHRVAPGFASRILEFGSDGGLPNPRAYSSDETVEELSTDKHCLADQSNLVLVLDQAHVLNQTSSVLDRKPAGQRKGQAITIGNRHMQRLNANRSFILTASSRL